MTETLLALDRDLQLIAAHQPSGKPFLHGARHPQGRPVARRGRPTVCVMTETFRDRKDGCIKVVMKP
jgi:hypothetical protein